MDGQRHGLDAVVAGEDLSRRAVDGEAGRAVFEPLDVDAASLRRNLGHGDGRNEQADHLRQRPAEGLAGDVRALCGEVLVELGKEFEGDRHAQLGDHLDVCLGEFAFADAVSESGKTVEDRHRTRQLTVRARTVRTEDRRDLDEVLRQHVVVDPLREPRLRVELGEVGQLLLCGLLGCFPLGAGELGVIEVDFSLGAGGCFPASVPLTATRHIAFGLRLMTATFQGSGDRCASERLRTFGHGELRVEKDLLEHRCRSRFEDFETGAIGGRGRLGEVGHVRFEPDGITRRGAGCRCLVSARRSRACGALHCDFTCLRPHCRRSGAELKSCYYYGKRSNNGTQ